MIPEAEALAAVVGVAAYLAPEPVVVTAETRAEAARLGAEITAAVRALVRGERPARAVKPAIPAVARARRMLAAPPDPADQLHGLRPGEATVFLGACERAAGQARVAYPVSVRLTLAGPVGSEPSSFAWAAWGRIWRALDGVAWWHGILPTATAAEVAAVRAAYPNAWAHGAAAMEAAVIAQRAAARSWEPSPSLDMTIRRYLGTGGGAAPTVLAAEPTETPPPRRGGTSDLAESVASAGSALEAMR